MLFAVSRRVTETFNERQASDFALGAGVAIDVAILAALGFDFHEKQAIAFTLAVAAHASVTHPRAKTRLARGR